MVTATAAAAAAAAAAVAVAAAAAAATATAAETGGLIFVRGYVVTYRPGAEIVWVSIPAGYIPGISCQIILLPRINMGFV